MKELTWFREIYDLHYESIRSFAYYKTGDVATADDVVQDTFLKLWSFRDKVRNESVKSLLYTIAAVIRVYEHFPIVSVDNEKVSLLHLKGH